jgi:hypothetical protein
MEAAGRQGLPPERAPVNAIKSNAEPYSGQKGSSKRWKKNFRRFFAFFTGKET